MKNIICEINHLKNNINLKIDILEKELKKSQEQVNELKRMLEILYKLNYDRSKL